MEAHTCDQVARGFTKCSQRAGPSIGWSLDAVWCVRGVHGRRHASNLAWHQPQEQKPPSALYLPYRASPRQTTLALPLAGGAARAVILLAGRDTPGVALGAEMSLRAGRVCICIVCSWPESMMRSTLRWKDLRALGSQDRHTARALSTRFKITKQLFPSIQRAVLVAYEGTLH